MIEAIAEVLEVSTTVVWGLAGLLAVQLAVMVWALIDLARRRRVRFDKKWVWAVVIVGLSNSFLGPILYAALGRNVPQETFSDDSHSPATNGERTRRAVDTLYGEGE